MKKFGTIHFVLWTIGLLLCWCYQPTTAMARPFTDGLDSLVTSPMTHIADSSKVASDNHILKMEYSRRQQQDSISNQNEQQIKAIEAPVDTSRLYNQNDSLSLVKKDVKLPKPKFVPDPQRALWLALVFPGGGQIYNKKYWKLPIFYGGFLGCTYALLWNQQMYMDYSQAYLDIMDDDPNTDSYLEMLPPRYNIEGQEERFKKIFKNKKDHFRRYRDLSAFCFVGVYILSVIDAYVDAQLSEFDITPDLSLRLEPAVIQQNGFNRDKSAYGVGCSIKF